MLRLTKSRVHRKERRCLPFAVTDFQKRSLSDSFDRFRVESFSIRSWQPRTECFASSIACLRKARLQFRMVECRPYRSNWLPIWVKAPSGFTVECSMSGEAECDWRAARSYWPEQSSWLAIQFKRRDCCPMPAYAPPCGACVACTLRPPIRRLESAILCSMEMATDLLTTYACPA